ncbi:hypothetical protein JQ597_04465 [Bradyrhizobium sp. AUGA SZCCT0177]|uniref:hypothetical protein n=1 Tax=Bradyrhizobium sp. AUGA SZCCT0177 TaxID=2807665 RepID=UPI001BAE420D|nr:hypothetical protein [Bradyrhizobium sp. AUGA SZCCT0177]MBR1281288.1 hypothetical protein [Bradyrhizobium sp. AUGA SZCCT0177]
MRFAVSTALAIAILSPSVGAAETLSAVRYDKNKDGILDETEALVWRLHVQDPILAKYDVNLNGRLDPAETERLRADSATSFSDRSRSVANDVLFFKNRKIADIDKVASSRPPPAVPAAVKPPKGGCENQQRLFVRRDRLDTYQYREGTFITGFVPKSKAKGASASFTHDDLDRSKSATINGRVSYVISQNDPMSPCFTGLPDDPYARHDFSVPSLFGTTVAVWTDAQGIINSPRTRNERSALKAGFDAQAAIAGGPFFDLQYLIASPYAQTDFRGEARIYGMTAAWEPFAPNVRLGGTIGAPATKYLDWFWQLRAEADVKRVDVVGATALTRGDYVWTGAVARLHLTPFPDRSVYDPFGESLFPDLVGRFYADITVNYHREFNRGIEALLWGAEVGFNITPDGAASISVSYTDGLDKDTLIKQRQYLVALNYKL